MKILLADDDPITLKMLKANLTGWKYEVETAADGDEAWRLLCAADAPRLAILDWMMPGLNGVELCQMLRQREDVPYTYVILLTIREEKNDLVFAMGVGADDYLSKPFDPQELEVRLMAGRRVLELQRQLIRARDDLAAQATHDHLTGLFNRAAILDILNLELARENRSGTPVGVAMADLDHFKQINDTHGHLVGDGVLKTTAQCMRASLRPYDSVGRYGGEEFLVILPGCGCPEAVIVAERLRRNVSESRTDQTSDEPGVTVSLGVASTREGTAKTAEGLLEAADKALYKAKAEGRDRVVIAPDAA